MGRSPKPINWDDVEMMMMAGATGVEIAGAFDLHPQSFYDRFEKEYNTLFTQSSICRKEGGKARLRHAQLKNALKGNTALLIRLGEVHLGQGQKVDIAPRDEELNQTLEDSKERGEFEEWKAQKNGAKPQAESECVPGSEEI